ncbi:hypothetical protein UPYG_G00274350 [Umbra pygmaea]|uniref:Uncharacterized protein n=1 Tax=Umbra pygmaea TaxID=75934 RepID=A0ABD0WHG8_UMBPY
MSSRFATREGGIRHRAEDPVSSVSWTTSHTDTFPGTTTGPLDTVLSPEPQTSGLGPALLHNTTVGTGGSKE